MRTTRLEFYFQNYVESHQSSGNQLTHYFGIPFIVVSLLGLLSHLTLGVEWNSYFRLDAGILTIFVGLIWYLLLDWKIAAPFGLVLGGLYFLGRVIPTEMNWILFFLGWVLQGVGHAMFEKKSPAFFNNMIHILIGPLWIFARLIRY